MRAEARAESAARRQTGEGTLPGTTEGPPRHRPDRWTPPFSRTGFRKAVRREMSPDVHSYPVVASLPCLAMWGPRLAVAPRFAICWGPSEVSCLSDVYVLAGVRDRRVLYP